MPGNANYKLILDVGTGVPRHFCHGTPDAIPMFVYKDWTIYSKYTNSCAKIELCVFCYYNCLLLIQVIGHHFCTTVNF